MFAAWKLATSWGLNCDHMLVPSLLLIITVLIPVACARAMIFVTFPPSVLGSSQIQSARFVSGFGPGFVGGGTVVYGDVVPYATPPVPVTPVGAVAPVAPIGRSAPSRPGNTSPQ